MNRKIEEQKVFKNAPITEAVIEFRINTLPDERLTELEEFEKYVVDTYPEKKTLNRGNIKITTGTKPVIVQNESIIGYRFISVDKLQIIQARLNGFSLSRLKPYNSWEEFINETKKISSLFFNHISIPMIIRVSLRYINKIELLLPIEDISKYIACHPTIPIKDSFVVSNFLNITEFYMNRFDTRVNLILTTKGTTKDILPIILDIDVMKNTEVDPDSSVVWETLDQHRHIKNELFFNIITKETQKLFE